jgi:hypothetical protein
MAIVRRIVCLANSRKVNGRCIAGRGLLGSRPGPWIRPVSAREHEEVSEYERQYNDGSDPQVLDIIDVPVIEPRANAYQPENWLLDPDHYWERVGRISPANLITLVNGDSSLWMNGYSSYSGQNNRIPADQAEGGSSLKLVRVAGVSLKVFAPGEAFGDAKRRVQARFRSSGEDYSLRVTDPLIERAFLARPDGVYELEDRFLTISLAEPFNGFCYKLVAAVIATDPDLGAA